LDVGTPDDEYEYDDEDDSHHFRGVGQVSIPAP